MATLGIDQDITPCNILGMQQGVEGRLVTSVMMFVRVGRERLDKKIINVSVKNRTFIVKV